MIAVYHGTSAAFWGDIEQRGLQPPPGHGHGVRVRTERADAREDAKAWCAYLMATRAVFPKAMVAGASVDPQRVREIRGGLFVPDGLSPAELRLKDFELTELFDEVVAAEALERFEELTNRILHLPFPREKVRAS